MNPMEILQRTPKTNCGECGYVACLAFAAAVTRAGADIRLCPYIKLDGLEFSESGPEKDMERLAEQVADEQDWALVKHLQEKVSGIDFGAIAGAIGAGWQAADPDVLELRYLGREVKLGKSSVQMEGKDGLEPRDQILLYNYVHSRGGRKPAGTWIGMESLPNSISKIKTLETYCERRIAKFLSGQPADILPILGRQLAGYTDTSDLGSTVTSSLIVPVLPMVPQFVLFWEEDAELGVEPRCKVLFDQNVLDYLDLESLVFSAERFAERLILLERNIK